MEMGSSRCGTAMTSEDEIKQMKHSLKDTCSERPKFFPCSECGRNFTLRALEIHKKSCTEKSDCACRVCKSNSTEKNGEHNGNCDENKNILLGFEKNSHEDKLNQSTASSLQKKKLIFCIQKKPLNVGNSNQIIQLTSTKDFVPILPCAKNILLSSSPGNGNELNNIQSTKEAKVTNGIKIVHTEISNNGDHCYDGNSKNGAPNKVSDKSDVGENNGSNLLNGTVLNVEQNSPQNFIVLYSSVLPSNSTSGFSPMVQGQQEKYNNEIVFGTPLVIDDKLAKPKQSPFSTPDHSLLCIVCNKLIFWDTFGCHVVQHSKLIDNKNLLCPKCPKHFSKPGKLLIHFYKHMSEFSFICRECKKSFQFCADLKNHALSEHGYLEFHPHHCYICLRRFSHSQTIINHMRLHSKETPFKCNECSRSFNQIGNLHRHLSVHRGERPHKCFQCNKSFADPATLRNHVRIHTGETPYVCKICSRAFTQVGNLKRHMARHFQDRSVNSRKTKSALAVPQEVTEVNFSVEEDSTEDSMDVDLDQSSKESNGCETKPSVSVNSQVPEAVRKQLEDGEEKKQLLSSLPIVEAMRICKERKWELFPCPECGKVYTWQHDLNIHFRIHSGEKPYSCDICDKKFAQGGAVRIHKLRHHGNNSNNCDSAKS